MLEKFLSRLSELSDVRLFFTRYAVNLIVLFEIICLPIILSKNLYVEMEVLKQVFLMTPIFVIGANSGLLYVNYTKGRNLSDVLISVSVLMGFFSGVFLFFYVGDIWSSFAVFSLVFVSAFEKKLIIDGHLILASLHKSFVSIVAISYASVLYYFKLDLDAISFYSQCVFFGILSWVACSVFSSKIKLPNFFCLLIRPSSWYDFGALVKSGFLISLQSYVLLLYFILDRKFVDKYFSEYLAEYTISFSLAQIVFIAINTVAFSAQRSIGSNINMITEKTYNNNLIKLLFVYFVLFALSVPLVFLWSYFLESYGMFLYSYILIVLFYGLYYVFSSYSIIAYYNGKSFYMLLALALSLSLSQIIMLLYPTDSYYIYLVRSGFSLLISAIIVDIMIRVELKNAM